MLTEVLPEGCNDWVDKRLDRRNYQGFRHSLCHGWSAGPAAILPERLPGINILAPGCKKSVSLMDMTAPDEIEIIK